MLPRYARKMYSELYPILYRDETALRLAGAIQLHGGYLNQED